MDRFQQLVAAELDHTPRRHPRQDDPSYHSTPYDTGSARAQAHVKNCIMAGLSLKENDQ